ncbi:MAG TPA: cytochrome b N-terminal domain-containing protein [bacterium]|nr:cytochrome b N-terminal domain-containing protein [bacterium]
MKDTFKKIWQWVDERTGLGEMLGPQLTHLVPHDARWWYVFGSATLMAFSLQIVTGILLAFTYVPSGGQAYDSLMYITHVQPWGWYLRALHFYGASAMILMMIIHMVQVFAFGSYKYPREMNWLSGVLLFAFTITLGFTGQLMRWDQNAVWSIMVAAEQAGRVPIIGPWLGRFIVGGDVESASTLTKFYALHVFVLPGIILAFIGLHLQLVLKNGISEPPTPGKKVDPATERAEYHELMEKTGVPFWPDAAWRDAVFGVGLLLAIMFCAWYFGAPAMDNPPDPSLTTANPQPDWYLMWYFAVLALMPPQIESVVMVFGPLLMGLLLFSVPFISNSGERHLKKRPWAVGAIVLGAILVGVLWHAASEENWSPHFTEKPLPVEVVQSTDAHVIHGATLFYDRGCINCHAIQGHGGVKGPDLTFIGSKLDASQIILRIANGGKGMPSFAGILKSDEMGDLLAFLQTRKHAPLPYSNNN